MIGYANLLSNQDKDYDALEWYDNAIKVYKGFINIYVLKAMVLEFKINDS